MGKNSDDGNGVCRYVRAESSKFASVSFDHEFQIWIGWNLSECHLTVFCNDPIVPGFVVYYVNGPNLVYRLPSPTNCLSVTPPYTLLGSGSLRYSLLF